MLLGEPTREPTGAMKTKKRAAERMYSLTASFLSFSPDAQHPVGGVPPPSPWAAVPQPTRKVTMFLLQRGFCVARSTGTQFAKMQSSFAKGFLRVAVAHPIRKNTFVLCKSMCACYFVSPGHCSCVENCYFRYWVKGQCPLWGAGAKPRMVPHAAPGNCLSDKNCCIRNRVQGTALVQGRSPSILSPGSIPLTPCAQGARI